MKAKDAHDLLAQYEGNMLYQQAVKIYTEETDDRIKLRAHGTQPSRGVVESVVTEMKDWFRKAAEGLTFEEPGTPENIIKWESSTTYVRHKVVDPEIEAYRKRTRLEMLRGSRQPLWKALTSDALDAVSGMMVASIQDSFRKFGELENKRKEFAENLGKTVCPFGAEERSCPHQKTYSMAGVTPTSMDDVVFVCTTDKCVKEGGEV